MKYLHMKYYTISYQSRNHDFKNNGDRKFIFCKDVFKVDVRTWGKILTRLNQQIKNKIISKLYTDFQVMIIELCG